MAAHGDGDFTAASRSMRFWGKLGWAELYAVEQIQVNIPSLLLLVAAKSKPCLWRKASACGHEACSQPCAVSTVQPARPLHSRPWGYRLLKWSSVPSITSLYYLHHQEKGNELFIEPLRVSCTAWLKQSTADYLCVPGMIQKCKHYKLYIKMNKRCIYLFPFKWNSGHRIQLICIKVNLH